MKTPFGNTVAAVKLAEMVENTPKARSYVGSTLQELNQILGQLFYIQNHKTRRHLCNITRKSFIDRIGQSTITPEVASFLKNVVIASCRNFKRHVDKPV